MATARMDERRSLGPGPGPARLPGPRELAGMLGVRLSLLRCLCGASQRGLARTSGVSVSTLRRYEAGRTLPRLGPLLRIAESLHTNLDYLLLGENPPSAAQLAEMRVQYKLSQISPRQASAVIELIDGILSQFPRRAAGG